MSDRDETTPQERMKAANKLRRLIDLDRTAPVEFLSKSGELHICDALCIPVTWALKFKAEALADLIDPTCHAEPVMYDLYGIEHTGLVRCSECHTVWREPDRVRYCPNCGARRVFDDGVAYSTG